MTWFWQKKKEDKEKKEAQSSALRSKRGLLRRKKDTKVSTKKISQKKDLKNQKTYGIVLGPIVTEKAARLAEKNTYVFQVTPKANKINVKRAVAAIYNVTPIKVNMVNISGKPKMFAQKLGKRASSRKAYVTIKTGEKIELFEEVKNEEKK